MKSMKIATWNVERPTRLSRKVPGIIAELNKLAPDILVLTETNDCIRPQGGYFVHSSIPLAPDRDGEYYKQGECRVIIYSAYPIKEILPVSDPCTTACTLVETPAGPLAVYGCIIGVHGRGKGFDADLRAQIEDLAHITQKYPVCYTGDLNLSFCDRYYTKKEAAMLLEKFFAMTGLKNLTRDIPRTIDHIVLSESYLKNAPVSHTCWNEEKTLSDHKGVMVTLQWENL